MRSISSKRFLADILIAPALITITCSMASEVATVTLYFFVPQGAKKVDIETYNMENEDLAEDYRTLIGTVDL